MSKELPKITFLVGAGLVAGPELLPTAIELTSKFRKRLGEQVSEGGDLDCPDSLALYNFLNGGIRFQAGVLNRDPDAPIDIETMATAALYLQRRDESPLAPYASGWHHRLRELEARNPNVVRQFLNLMFASLDQWLTVDDVRRLSYLARFEDFNKEWDVDIFSLNYDVCIEAAFAEFAKIEFENGFTEDGWAPDRLHQKRGLRLVKLHGSLDWVDDEEFGICSTHYPRHIHADEFEEGKPPLLIFGTDAKITGRDPFLTLLYIFSSRVEVTDLLVTIGYSFGDDYLNDVIQQRLISNPRLRLLLVSPSASARAKGACQINLPDVVYSRGWIS